MSLMLYNQIANDFEVGRASFINSWSTRIQHLDPQIRQQLECELWVQWEERHPDDYDCLGLAKSIHSWLNQQLPHSFFFPIEGLHGGALARLIAELEHLLQQLHNGKVSYCSPLHQLASVFPTQAITGEFYSSSPIPIEERVTQLLDFLKRHRVIYGTYLKR